MVPEKYHFESGKKIVDRPAFGAASQLDENGELKEIWRVEGWYAFTGHLTNDGRYFVRMGPWASDQEGHSDLAVAFYDNGKLLKEYLVKDLIKDVTKLEYSVSHYQWQPEKQSKPTGFEDPYAGALLPSGPGSSLFHLVMIDHTTYDFDFTTGVISATGLDKGALSSNEIRSMAMAEAAQRGNALLQSSPEEARLKTLFEVSEVNASENSKTYGVYFEGPEWSAKLTPKTAFKYPCEIHAIHPVSAEDKLLIGIKADELLAALKMIVEHPYVENRFSAHSAQGIRVRVAGDRLHWDTDELKELLALLKKNTDSLESFKLCAEVIVDEPGHVYHSFYLNTQTGQIIKED